MRLLIAAGGTGGHIYPALAVARSLRAQPAAPELRWVGGHRGLESEVVAQSGLPLRLLLLRSLRSVDLNIHAVLDPIKLALSIPQAFAMLLRWRPAAVFTTGGYVAIPVMLAASALRIPVMMWDGNVVPGRSVRMTARLARALAVTFPETVDALGGRERTYVTGTPIRDPAAVDRGDARRRLGLPDDEPLLLIFGGSQAVRRFNQAVHAALPRLVSAAYVIHVTGEAGYGGARAGRDSLPAELRERYRPEKFLHEEMDLALAAADLVVGRAGSSTLAEVSAFGLPMVVVPYPHAAGHQRLNAAAMVREGAARLVEDEDFDADALLAAAAIVADRAVYDEMSAAARRLARPRAADAVAALVMAVAERRQLPPAQQIEAMARGAAW